MGGEGKIIEADETYFGKREDPQNHAGKRRPSSRRQKRPGGKRAVVALVERGGQSARSM